MQATENICFICAGHMSTVKSMLMSKKYSKRKPPQLSGGFPFVYDLLKHCNQIV